MLFKLFLIFIVIWLIIRRWQKRRLVLCCEQFKNDIMGLPIIGHTYMAVGNNEVKMKAFQTFGREALKQGGMTTILKSWLLDRYYVVVADPKIAEFILKNCLEKDDSMKMFSDSLGDGLMALPVHQWRPRRKVLNPAFSLKNLNQFVEIFKKNSNILVEKLRQEAGMGPFSVYDYTAAFTLDSVCETMLGAEVGSLHDKEHPIMGALNSCCTLVSNRMCLPWLHNQTIYEMTSQCAALKENADTLFRFIGKFIPSNLKKKNADTEDVDTKYRKTILELMIEANNDDIILTKKYMMDESLIVTVAGMETTAITISYILKLLARHQDVQEKLFEEITQYYDTPDKEIHYDDLPHFKYMESVIKESLRLYPPGAILLRQVDKDVVLPNGKTLVKGIGVAINVWAVHRNPDYWGPDPEIFRPERWEDGCKHPGAFLAFSTGSRNCIGYQYAMMSLKTALTTILRNFRITPAKYEDTHEPFRVKFDIMMRDVDGYQIQLKSR